MPPSADADDAATHSAGEHHRSAVANTLRFADDAAATGDYHDALAWLATLEAIGELMPAEYRAKQRAWTKCAQAATQ